VAPRPHPALVVPPGAAIAFGCAVAEEESALMARVLTGGGVGRGNNDQGPR
jgi:hypothetical protein